MRDPVGPICTTKFIGNIATYKVRTARLFPLAYVPADFDYMTGSEHQLGVGVSASGGYGEYEVGGSVTRSSTAGFSTGEIKTPKRVYTKWTYGKYYSGCLFRSKARHYYGGVYYETSGRPGYSACANQPRGSTFRRDSGRQETMSAAAKVAGLELSAQTGWTTETKVSYKFNRAGKMCGTGGLGPGTAAQVKAIYQ